MEPKKYFLDFTKLENLGEKQLTEVFRMYIDLLHVHADGRKDISTGLFNTLEMNGFIKNRDVVEREEKLGKLIEKVLQPDKWMPPSVKEIMKKY
jgi:hypothetical protein